MVISGIRNKDKCNPIYRINEGSTLFLTLTRTQFLYRAMYSRQDLDYRKFFISVRKSGGQPGGAFAKHFASSTAHVPLHVSPIFLSRKDLRLDLVDILLKIYAMNSVYLFTSCLYLLVRVFIKVMNVLKASLEGNSVRL